MLDGVRDTWLSGCLSSAQHYDNCPSINGSFLAISVIVLFINVHETRLACILYLSNRGNYYCSWRKNVPILVSGRVLIHS